MDNTTPLVTELRQAYEGIKAIDPASKAYAKLINFLDTRPTVELKILVAANIKWVSMLARNRIISRS